MNILDQPLSALSVDALKSAIESALDDNKAEDITTIDLAGKSSVADYMIIASGRSQRHVSTLADKLSHSLKSLSLPPLSVEGLETSDWVVVDCGDIIVHLFRPGIREIYQLEKMWSAPVEPALAEAGA